jgi:hypothetical protein
VSSRWPRNVPGSPVCKLYTAAPPAPTTRAGTETADVAAS